MNKIKFFLATLLVCALPSLAQQTSSPYSSYGYGVLGDRATSMQRQMGGIGYAMNSGRQVNVMNPASYASVDSMTFLFDIGADLSMLWSEDNGKREYSTGGGLDYVTMQFPICKYMGGSVGLIPYSNVGYAFGNEIEHGAMENQGSGGINELYLGVSGKIKGFSLGVNVSYDFGNIVNDVFAVPEGGGQAKYEHVLKVRDWNILIGAQYTQRLSRFDRLTVGATFSPKKTLLGKTWVTRQETTQDSYPDTIGYMHLRNNYYTPNTVGVGLNYTREKVSRLMVELDYTWQGWKDCKYAPVLANMTSRPTEVAFDGMTFNDRHRISAGAEFVPRVRGSYGQRMAYRLGGYYAQDYITVKGNSVREYGVTAGLGFPTPEGKTVINLGLEWKHRQAHPNPLLTENYLNVTLGVNFNEVWFFKRKIR